MRLCASFPSASVADPTQLRRVGDGYEDNKKSVFTFSTETERKKFTLLIFPTQSEATLCLPHQENGRQSRDC